MSSGSGSAGMTLPVSAVVAAPVSSDHGWTAINVNPTYTSNHTRKVAISTAISEAAKKHFPPELAEIVMSYQISLYLQGPEHAPLSLDCQVLNYPFREPTPAQHSAYLKTALSGREVICRNWGRTATGELEMISLYSPRPEANEVPRYRVTVQSLDKARPEESYEFATRETFLGPAYDVNQTSIGRNGSTFRFSFYRVPETLYVTARAEGGKLTLLHAPQSLGSDIGNSMKARWVLDPSEHYFDHTSGRLITTGLRGNICLVAPSPHQQMPTVTYLGTLRPVQRTDTENVPMEGFTYFEASLVRGISANEFVAVDAKHGIYGGVVQDKDLVVSIKKQPLDSHGRPSLAYPERNSPGTTVVSANATHSCCILSQPSGEESLELCSLRDFSTITTPLPLLPSKNLAPKDFLPIERVSMNSDMTIAYWGNAMLHFYDTQTLQPIFSLLPPPAFRQLAKCPFFVLGDRGMYISCADVRGGCWPGDEYVFFAKESAQPPAPAVADTATAAATSSLSTH